MARQGTLVCAALSIGAALALYGIAHHTRQIEQRVQAQERAVERTESDIAVLAAERAWLGRPERIEELARLAGLAPITESQYTAVESGTDDGISGLLLAPGPAPAPTSAPGARPR